MARNKIKAEKSIVTKIVIGIVIAVVVLVLGMGIGMTVFGEPGDGTFLSRFTAEKTEQEHAVELNEFLVNIKGESTRSKAIVRMEITVTSMDDEIEGIINQDIAKVRDAVIHVVSDQTDETILEEENGEFIIKDLMRDRINQALDQEIIKDVYVTNVLIQN